jgi:hypothetical protein
MGNDKMREEFEAWVLGKWPETELGQFNDGEYCGFTLQHCWAAWQASRAAVWQPIDTCPQHQEVLFFRHDAGVFTGMITDADHFMSDKERDEWEGAEEGMFEIDAFGYGDWGVCRCDGSERPTHWMPLPAEPEVKP